MLSNLVLASDFLVASSSTNLASIATYLAASSMAAYLAASSMAAYLAASSMAAYLANPSKDNLVTSAWVVPSWVTLPSFGCWL
jgi:hypothetical protein